MASDGHSTVEKSDNYVCDKEGPRTLSDEEPSDFPEGGLRAWMTLVGRFDHMGYTFTEFDRNHQLSFSILHLWVRFGY